MTPMLAPILAFCAVGALAVAATIALGAVLAKRHNRAKEAQERRVDSASDAPRIDAPGSPRQR